ncbi:unnamed protein product [Microthlaspi erraticum]|uniref:Uncharacterized protein n=1 Tax=Microthlaspi erraticum TaxID=1685480 RepID=A0A6D2HMW2_9BRAS|nr:unnamed protein product [Microthlaspi erraticum]
MDFQSFSFAPHVIQNALNLAIGWSSTVEVADYEVFVQFCTFFEHFIWNSDSRCSLLREGFRSQFLKRFILKSSDSSCQGWRFCFWGRLWRNSNLRVRSLWGFDSLVFRRGSFLAYGLRVGWRRGLNGLEMTLGLRGENNK